ncbi:hydroxymethylglutaryl-CoA reductase, degradative [Myxococcus sp. MISCRS1]|uniref:hydroxymethylglutaryl-CoA reductase, degradative n=1 Tax=Myxococcus TaxID=32 RepID=UPI00226DAE95|nr:hydroxymethylglutaryl-CoA reductase, degradative [Myxococcus sp. MISCRS1]MCY0999372.1 hydroxymethylglutaryl-CoA reductase, degradative [Myxococcus sp. MISCRS1]
MGIDISRNPFSGFHRLSLEERCARVASELGLSAADLAALTGEEGLGAQKAYSMVENALGYFSLPLGLGLNLQVNGRAYVAPMVIEEASVIAAVSFAAKLVGSAGGFVAGAEPSLMVGQVQLTRYGDPESARARILAARSELLELANALQPQLVRRGGGAKDLEVRLIDAPEGPLGEPLLVVHFHIDTQEAMGANLINTMMEGVAPRIEALTGGRVFLRILSNLADRRLARSRCVIPEELLADYGLPGADIAEGIVQASRFAQADPYRAATHNKGIMNGIDAIALATGQDWRAIEAGAHAYAARTGRYLPLSTWRREDGNLVGEIELPLALGTVGGPLLVHPGVKAAFKVLGHPGVRELACLFASVGLAQNLAAVRALGSVGIQKGHMALHARSVAVSAGTPPEWVETVAALLVQQGEVKVDQARRVLGELKGGVLPFVSPHNEDT